MSDNLSSLLASDPLLAYLYRRVASTVSINDTLSEEISAYLLKYLEYEGVSGSQAYKIYEGFVKRFNKDIEAFTETGLYPVQIDPEMRAMSRLEYDIVLMISCLASPHRYDMMRHLVDASNLPSISAEDRHALFVGCGPGLEIHLLKDLFAEMTAFDISLGENLAEMLPGTDLRQEFFPPKGSQEKYDDIYLIEILEHLEDPMVLLKDCIEALTDKGRLYLTTATDLPQFDHLYNFPVDHSAFEEETKALGLHTEECYILEHNYFSQSIAAKNHLYVMTKR